MAQHEQWGTAWHSHTAWVDRTPNTPRWSLICDRVHSTSTAQSHGAHSHEWLEPHCDPRWVGNGFGNEKISDHGRSVFFEHGCRTGRAMVKYPGYRKNAHTQNTRPMPVGVPLPNGPCTLYLRSGNFAQHFFTSLL